MSDSGDVAVELSLEALDKVFCDTNIALNFVQIELEGDRTSALVTDAETALVIGESVADELEAVCDRRVRLYEDILDFILAQEGELNDYTLPDELRRQSNDRRTVRSLKMTLSSKDTTEVRRLLRRLMRQVEVRAHRFRDEYVDDVVTVMTPFGLSLALDDVIPNSDDVTVVEEAVTNARDGGGNVLITMDNDDLLDKEEQINTVLADMLDDEIHLHIVRPSTVLE